MNVIVNGNKKDIEKFSSLNNTSKDWNGLKVINVRDVKLEDFRKQLHEGKFL